MTTPNQTGLLSPSDIADLAGVKRPLVSNWRKRYDDFPSAAAGTEAKPLFRRDDVVTWLRQRGRVVKEESAGAQLWSALNTIRDRVSLEDATELVLLLATVKHAQPQDFETLTASGKGVQMALADAVSKIPQIAGLPDALTVSPEVFEPHWDATPILQAIAHIDSGALGDAVDFVLERLSRWQIKSGGESGFIGSRTSALLVSLVGSADGTVYDPACGIATALVQVARQHSAQRIVGSDISITALRIAALRAFLHGVDIELMSGDVLTLDPAPTLHADIVVLEPPFGTSWDPSLKLDDPRFSFGLPPRSRADLAWVQLAVAHLAPNGRAFVLTTPGALFRTAGERQIRANLLSAGHIEAIVALPPKMLPQTSIAPSLWVLRPRTDASDVLLIDASDISDAEKRVSAWLSQKASRAEDIAAPHRRVTITEILSADAVLTPGKWIHQPAPTTSAIASTFEMATAKIGATISEFASAPMDFEMLDSLPEPRIATVRELIENGVIELLAGRPDRTRQLDEATAKRLVKVPDIRTRHLAQVEGLPDAGHPDLTEAQDVLVTTMNDACAVVDESGGHLPSTGVDRLRILDRSVIAPGYLAAVITGPWNARLHAGTTMRRAPIRDLEIPLVPLADQNKVLESLEGLGLIVEQSQLLGASATLAQNSILNALRYHGVWGTLDVPQTQAHTAPTDPTDPQ